MPLVSAALMTPAVMLCVMLALPTGVPLVAPPEPAKPAPAPPPAKKKPAPAQPAQPAPGSPPPTGAAPTSSGAPAAPVPDQPPPGAAPGAPQDPNAPAQPGAQPPGIPSTGVPLVDRLLNLLPQESQEDLTQWPVLKEGDPRPLISYRFDYDDFLNASYFREQTLRGFVQSAIGKPVDPEAAESDARAIGIQYKLRGFGKVRVKWAVDKSDRGDILVFTITAGSRGQLKQMDTVGNVALSREVLLTGLFHKPLNILALLNFADRGGVYHAGYIEQDIRQIQKNYADRGYLASQVKDARIYALDDDGKELRLVFDVRDGPLFRVGMLNLTGDLPYDLRTSVLTLGLKPGSPAELMVLDAGVERLLDVWRNRSYAGARAVQERRIRESDQKLDIIIRIEKGPPTRVGAVRIVGDPTTADHVIKRDVAVREGQRYSLRALRLSEERLMYTGLFTKVTLKPVPTPDPTVVDVEVEVVEQQSWYFSLAPSWIPGEGLVGLGFIGFRNFWAPDLLNGSFKPRGQAWRVNASGVVSRRRQTGRIDVEDPRILDTRLSVGGNVHRDRYVYPEFSQVRTGGAVTLGYPLIEYSQLSMGYSLERVDFESGGPVAAYAGTARFPNNKRRAAVRFDASYDRRDNVLFPSRGLLLSTSMEYGSALLLGEMDFLTLSANARFYFPMPFGFVFKSNTAGAYVVNPKGGVVPVSERFYEGGPIQSVRGYTWQSISPTVTLGNGYDPAGEKITARLGGVSRFVQNLEVETPPIPVFPMLPLKLFLFLDGGNTWSETEKPFFFPNILLPKRDGTDLPLGMFYSVGVGGMLATPLFPLRIDFTVPLTRRPQDELINFFISAGSPF